MVYRRPFVEEDVKEPSITTNSAPQSPFTSSTEPRRSPASYSFQSGERTYVNRTPATPERTHASYSGSSGEKTAIGQRPQRQPSGPSVLSLGAVLPMTFQPLMGPAEARRCFIYTDSQSGPSPPSYSQVVQCYAQVILLSDSLTPWTSMSAFRDEMLGFLKLSTLFLQETSTSSIHSKAPFKQSCQHFLDNMALEYNILISSLGQLLQETLFQFHREGLRHSELFLPELYRQSSSTSTSNNLPSKTSPQTQPLFHRLSSPDLTHQVQIITHTLVEKLTALIADAKYAQRHTYARQLEDPIKAVLCITDKEVGKGAKGQEKAIDLANKLVEWNCLPNIVEVENAVVGGVRVFV